MSKKAISLNKGAWSPQSRLWLGRTLLFCAAVLVVGMIAGPALARMGGGHSFGGGGYSSGGGGGGGGGDDALVGLLLEIVFRLLFELCVHYPEIGIPLVLIIAGGYIALQMTGGSGANSRSVNELRSTVPQGPPPRARNMARAIRNLRETDPNFSRVLFLDFARLLYTRYHEARGIKTGTLEPLRPFVAPSLTSQLENQRNPQSPMACNEVKDVIVGSAAIDDLNVSHDKAVAHVLFITNYTNVDFNGTETPYYVEERVSFRRSAKAISPGPEKMRSLHCPSCGSPVQCDERGVCAHCGAPAKPGENQWELYAVSVNKRQHRDAFDCSTPESRRTMPAKPLVMDPNRNIGLRDLAARDPNFTMQKFEEKVKEVFLELQTAWSDLDWERTRSLQTKSLYQQNLFWVERYRRRRWVNRLDDPTLLKVFPVKIEKDAFYDTITVRITAMGKDYTLNENKEVISGSKTVGVEFREYWTFVRRAGYCATDAKDEALADDFQGGESAAKEAQHCPNCGAPVPDAAAQECPYCGSVIESTEFDWTLAFIDQEGAYLG